ncbi:hypothetical protein OGATHE_003216 [Ogataea polymorpha]|uniref:Uncharacterized protein n=1 Tax=Ogataea polymorpha TaxID=460523 RepID=A0A9P8P8T8_9ASCO|nr:hypothetical protein OGATHE_003216 [Ogataea polymorpha]
MSTEPQMELQYSPKIHIKDPRESESVSRSTFCTSRSIKLRYFPGYLRRTSFKMMATSCTIWGSELARSPESTSIERSATDEILMARFPMARMLLRTIWSSISKAYSSSSRRTSEILLSLASKKISSSFVSLMYTGSSNWQKNIETCSSSISALSSSSKITFRMVRNWISAGLDMRFDMHPETRFEIAGRTSTKFRT